MGQIIDGRKIAREIRTGIKQQISDLGTTPSLAIISVGYNDASEVYLKQKKKVADEIGIRFQRYHYESATTQEIINRIQILNVDPGFHGIIVQLPLPENIMVHEVLSTVLPQKDVDGFHPVNMGKILFGQEGLAPCTPKGIIRMLDHEGIELQGKEVVVINHSNVVGKPLALMLLNRNATVSVCHIFSRDLHKHTREADILITAAGVPNLIREDMVKKGVVIIDVSMNRVEGRLCGDVAFDEMLEKASYITPVPGGVGPMTVAMLMENTLMAAKNQ